MIKLINEVYFLSSDASIDDIRKALIDSGIFFAGKVLDVYDPDNKIKKIKKVKNTERLIQAALVDREGVIKAYNYCAAKKAFKLAIALQWIPVVQLFIDIICGVKINKKILQSAQSILIKLNKRNN